MTDGLVWMSFWKPKDAWYYAGAAERTRLLERWQQITSTAVGGGAVHVGTYAVRANSRWARTSIWEFPDLHVLVDMLKGLEEAEYYRYIDDENLVGEPDPDPFAPYLEAAVFTDRVVKESP